MTIATREEAKIHYIALTKPELVRATIRKEKDVTRRVQCPQNTLKVAPGAGLQSIWEPGSLLGIKESWAVSSFSQKSPGKLQICYRAGGAERPLPLHPDDEGDCDRLWREVDWDTWQRYAFRNQWRGPRFMPGWAVRLWGQVKSVRLERVQEVTEAEAVREGIASDTIEETPRQHFVDLWNAINDDRGFPWERNPWVWRIEWELLTSTGLEVEK